MTTFPDFLRVAPALELKLAAETTEQGVISGYAATFGGEPDSYGDIIAESAFAPSIARHKAEGTAPLMLWGHDPDRPVGRWTDFGEDRHGLVVKGKFNLDTTAGKEAHAHVKAGDLSGLSIGYRVLPNGAKAGPNGTRILTNVDWLEASVVGFPANRRARVTGVKSFGSRAELETIIREAGVPSRAVKKLLSGGWPAVSGDSDEPDEDPAISELFAAVKAARLDFKGR